MSVRPVQRSLICAFALTLVPIAAAARETPSDLCLAAASEAASRTGVPYEVLLAITKVETGRDDQPWPWTVNFGGDGRWYDSAAAAEEGVTEALNAGATNVDLGCFQLNYRWHAQAFSGIADMLDPVQNATYAAEFLARHYAETGDWALAAAAYHSQTPEYAAAYKAKFEAAYGTGDPTAPPPQSYDTADVERLNSFPLLVAGASGTRGSLVPAGSGGRPLIGGP